MWSKHKLKIFDLVSTVHCPYPVFGTLQNRQVNWFEIQRDSTACFRVTLELTRQWCWYRRRYRLFRYDSSTTPARRRAFLDIDINDGSLIVGFRRRHRRLLSSWSAARVAFRRRCSCESNGCPFRRVVAKMKSQTLASGVSVSHFTPRIDTSPSPVRSGGYLGLPQLSRGVNVGLMNLWRLFV